jgi:large repetitive protein
LVQGNLIGTDASGANPLPNGINGVSIGGISQSDSNTIGGTTAGAGNVIAFNHGNGVTVYSGTGNAISRNSIFSNGGLGVDLGGDGVTPNDPGDTDTGPNNLQNFPVLTFALVSQGGLVVQGTIDTPIPQTVTLEFFANLVPVPGGDPSGHGEGATFLGTATPAPDGTFTAALPTVAPGTLISATATDAVGDTSEFAEDIAAVALPTSADQCKKGGWRSFGVFKNQGDCVSYVATGGKNLPG